MIPRVYGRARLAGQIIWATDFEEADDHRQTAAARAARGGGTETTEYSYFANFAVGALRGADRRHRPHLGRRQAARPGGVTFRVYRGDEDQERRQPDRRQAGSGDAPAYRGTAYVVFERCRSPISATASRSFRSRCSGRSPRHRGACARGLRDPRLDRVRLRHRCRSRATRRRRRRRGGERACRCATTSDWTVSIDELQALCPNLEWVTLVVAWFGDDLRAGALHDPAEGRRCAAKATTRRDWQVSGLTRGDAQLVSQRRAGGRPMAARPSDLSVVRAIEDLKARGLKVRAGAVRPDGHSGGQCAARSVRTTRRRGPAGLSLARAHHLHPGAGRAGSPDKTAAAADAGRGVPRRGASRAISPPADETVAYSAGRRSGAFGAWCCTTRISPRWPAASTRS